MSYKISAVVPTYNSEKIIKECLDSLIAQTHPFDEIIIVDNASTDKTREIIKGYPFKKILLEKNMERCVSRNTGWQAAQNELVAIIENDSVYDRHWAEKVLECFEKGADAVVDRRAVYKPVTFISRMNDEFFTVRLLKNEYKPYSAWVFQKSILEELGGYDEGQVGFEDMELGKRLIDRGYKIVYQPDALSCHAGEPATLRQELKRSWWFGIRAHKYYKKYPGEFPYARFIGLSLLTLSILQPYVFIILLAGACVLLFIKFILMKMNPVYAAAEAVLSVMRLWVFFIAYVISSIDRTKRR
jgi:glycosyltransferase involved in cell wall biosynthesis